MTQSSNNGASTMDIQETKKQRKKQAKREAKRMLKLEQARTDVQKGEQKLAKAQARLEAARTHLGNLEAQMAEMHTSQADAHTEQQEFESSMSQTDLDGQQPENNAAQTTGQENVPSEAEGSPHSPSSTNQETFTPPAEGRTDIAADIPQEEENAYLESESTSEPFIVSEEDESTTDEQDPASRGRPSSLA